MLLITVFFYPAKNADTAYGYLQIINSLYDSLAEDMLQ